MEDYPIRQLVLYKDDFGWMAFLEMDPGVTASLWLKVFELGGGASFWLKVSMIREGGPCPF
jgi:hypothetical protein